MNNEYYNFWFRLNAQDGHLIYIDGEPDGFVTNEFGKVPYFLNTEDLLLYAKATNLPVEADNQNLTNLDILAAWLESKDADTVNCKTFLEAWNLFDDFSKTVDGNFDADQKKTQKIYNKLFWGDETNILIPEGESYTPIWSKRELKIIREVLGEGLLLFKEKTVCV